MNSSLFCRQIVNAVIAKMQWSDGLNQKFRSISGPPNVDRLAEWELQDALDWMDSDLGDVNETRRAAEYMVGELKQNLLSASASAQFSGVNRHCLHSLHESQPVARGGGGGFNLDRSVSPRDHGNDTGRDSDPCDELSDGDIVDNDLKEEDLMIEVFRNLERKHLSHFSDIIRCMNALFMQQTVLTESGFTEKDILRFFRLVIKVFSPEPPKRSSKVPRKPNRSKQDQSESTKRLQILMNIWKRTGIQNFRCDALKIIRGIFFATANPMLVNLIITAIHSVDSFADLRMKRMCLFLIALAAGISCDSPIVKEPQLLVDFFNNVFEAISQGMDESNFDFDRESVLPDEYFSQHFADDAWHVLDHVNTMFAKIPNSAPAESSRKPAAKKQQAASAADERPFDGFDIQVLDDVTIMSACSIIDAQRLPFFMQHIFHCFYHTLKLLETPIEDIMGLTTKRSLEFVILSLLHASMQPIPAIAFTQFSSLLSMIEKVGATRFFIAHEKSADFSSRLGCLARLLRPEDDKADEFLKAHFAHDMNAFANRSTTLASVMMDLFCLFRRDLLDDKRRVLDAEFTKVFPDVKFEAVQPTPQKREKVRFQGAGGGAAAESETVVVSLHDINPDEFRQFQEWKRLQAQEAAKRKGKK